MALQIIAIDAGNTALKIGFFKSGELVRVDRHSYTELISELESNSTLKQCTAIISSVISDEKLVKLINLFNDVKIVNSSTTVPFLNQYKTPLTLGVDRYCNAAYAFNRMEKEYAVVIDIGTCIKFDVIHQSTGYLGGTISPGIDLRYKALHQHTDKLPLLSNKTTTPIVGDSTKSSMQSGVINGIQAELEHFMEQFRSNYQNLTFFVTGGDAQYFDLHSKNDIFADENLTLIGLYEIYQYNA